MVVVRPNLRSNVRPLAVIAWADADRAALLTHLLYAAGWRVVRSEIGADARQLVARLRPAVAVFADLPDETGALACAKLARCRRRTRVILLDEDGAERDRFAAFVGAAARLSPTGPVRHLAARITALAPLAV